MVCGTGSVNQAHRPRGAAGARFRRRVAVSGAAMRNRESRGMSTPFVDRHDDVDREIFGQQARLVDHAAITPLS